MVKHKLLREVKLFSLEVVKHFIKNNCSNRAQILTFSTLLSLVPLSAVFFGILIYFPVFTQFSQGIENFIFTHFLPATGRILQNYFQSFVHNALKLAGINLVFLLAISIKMIFTIEEFFNAIWQVKKKRPFLLAVMLYASILVFFPLIVGMSLLLFSYTASFSIFSSATYIIGLKKVIFTMIPFIVIWGMFFLFYIILPYAKVKLTAAFYGALFSALLFEMLKSVFGWCIRNFISYEILYGTLSLVPIFIIWIYCVWLIILLGAVFAYVLPMRKLQQPI